MKTKTIRYEQLRSLSGYNHIKIGKEVELEDGDDEAAVMDQLQLWVRSELGISLGRMMLREEVDRLRDEEMRINDQIAVKREELDRLRGLISQIDELSVKLEQAGVKLPDGLLLEIPF